MENKSGFWYSNRAFPLFTAIMAAGVFAGTHLYYTAHTGVFNELSVVAMLTAALHGGGYGAAAAYGISFMLARVFEGSLTGVLDIGGGMQTGIGIGIPALLLGAGVTAPLASFPLALLTGALLGYAVGAAVLWLRARSQRPDAVPAASTYGSDIIIGAGNSAARFLGPLVVASALTVSIPIGLGALAGAILFYLWDRPVAAGAIVGAMVLGTIFPVA
ncbi:DUF4310 family protein [Paenibacillus hemerocallicola]|uniref:DUF4310 family protein n=1 Tax=Paenibacillus hemerocallicola TaxID=1172614 RepID=A0A5C4SZX4_9BACL|nr:DUF4310 family protein [Paenibacillus hemerocallicola]TNJ60867.1 DUF4310 family protein [Paenibacillus hemerocallicola]